MGSKEKVIELAAKPKAGFEDVLIGSEENQARPGTANTANWEDDKKKSLVTKEQTAPIVANKPIPTKKNKQAVSSMNRYAQYDKYHPLNQPFPAIENFKGPKYERKPTDVYGIIFPFIFGAAFIFHLVVCHLNGWPTLLTKPLDFRAKLCGVGSLKQRPYLYFLTPSIDLNVAMCVDVCPTTTGKPINMYEKDGSTLTPFTYTRIQCDTIGKYCYPGEPTPRTRIESFLTTPIKYIKRIIGELFLVVSWITRPLT